MRVIGKDYGAVVVEALRAVVSGLKADDPMASVTILVPNNRAGIVARRQLAGGLADGPRPGVAALHVSTLPRLAEQLAAASLVPRRPATRPLVAAAWRRALTEGVTEQAALVRALVGSALDSELVKRAAVRAHWRETYVGTVDDEGTILEGFVDLVYREDDGSLVIVDYKTDAIPPAAIGVRATYYRPQLDAYVRAHRDATGEPVSARLLFLTPGAAATEVRLADDGTGLE